MYKVNVDRVRGLIFESGLSLAELARRAGLNVLTVKRALNGDATATVRTIGTLAKFFGVPGDELILKA